MYRFAACLMLLTATSAHADWQLRNDASRLAFVSTKAGAVAEVHRFTSLEGNVDAEGNARISIALASVDTLIPVRDERMREMLFETTRFPTATIAARIDAAAVERLAVGATTLLALPAELALHGTTLPLTLEVTVAKLAAERLLVASTQPLVINAAQVGLADGVEKLREVAGLPAISPAVPISFVLTFEQSR